MKRKEGAVLEEERARLNRLALRRQFASADSRDTLVDLPGNGDGREIHKLWSDGADNGVFENNHGCWDFFKVLN